MTSNFGCQPRSSQASALTLSTTICGSYPSRVRPDQHVQYATLCTLRPVSVLFVRTEAPSSISTGPRSPVLRAAESSAVTLTPASASTSCPAASTMSATHAAATIPANSAPRLGPNPEPLVSKVSNSDSLPSAITLHASTFRSPLHVTRFSSLLCTHPEPQFSRYVLHGLHHGFDIGFSGDRNVNVNSPNRPSAAKHAQFISDQLAASCSRRETAGPFTSPPFSLMHCSGVGAVPKKNCKMRMIHHLSSPLGTSVNDGIPTDIFSLQYVTTDDAINMIMSLPPPVYLSKLDVKNAFRQIPVRIEDFPLLGIFWQGRYYYEQVLPFGLRSSPFIFNTVADAIEWIIKHHFSISDLLHYLDDFLNAVSSLSVANRQLAILLREFMLLGVPLAPDKIGGPAQCLTFLGIELDCVSKQARLPSDKLTELRSLLTATLQRNSISQRSLESLLGKLSFAARVVVPGCTFLRRLWSVCSRYQEPHYKIVLDSDAMEDIRWWQHLLQHWNGKSFFLHPNWTPSPDLQLYTDASGSRGWGAYNNGRWINGTWTREEVERDITWKELYALLVACATWGHAWAKLRILIHCDNAAVVDCVKSGSSKSAPVMQLLHGRFFVCAKHNFTISAIHIAGNKNLIADSLSRFSMQAFRRLAPSAKNLPDNVIWPQYMGKEATTLHALLPRTHGAPIRPVRADIVLTASCASGNRSQLLTFC